MEYSQYLASHGLRQDYVEKVWAWRFEDGGIIMPAYDKDKKYHHWNKRMLTDDPKVGKFKTETDTHPSMYGIHKAISEEVIVYCEGQADCVKLWQEGIPAVTATGGVKKFDEDMAVQLTGKTIYLCIDNDEAGQKEVLKYWNILSRFAKEVKIVDLPVGAKDVCEFFQGHTTDDFLSLMDQAVRSVDEWTVKHSPSEHRIESLTELFSADLPPDKWIVDKVIPAVGFSVFAGAAAAGKSFLSLDIARAILANEKWLNLYEIKKQVKILFVDKENERINFRTRARGLKMVGDTYNNLFRLVYPEAFSFLSDKRGELYSDFARTLSAFVKVNDIGLIVFDSLVDFMQGNENEAEVTQGFFDAIRELLPGRSILLLAHYTKATKFDVRSPLERIAGSRNLGAQVSSGIAIERSPDADNEIYIQGIKARNAKNNTTQYKVLIHSMSDPENPGDTIVTGFEMTGEVEEKVEKITGTMNFIAKMVDEGGMFGAKRQDILTACAEAGTSERTANRAITEMKRSGLFEMQKVAGSTKNEHALVRKIAKIDDSFHGKA